MVEMALLALLGGISLGLNRIFISRLGMSIGAFRSSYWNHVGGFVLLLGIMLFIFPFSRTAALWVAPPWAYLGGVIGAFFVALSSIVMPRIGTTRALALVISGQMIISTLIDFALGKLDEPGHAMAGVALILCGALLPARRKPA